METIIDYFRSLFEMLFSFVDLFIAFIGDIVQMVVSLTKLPEILYTVLQWTTSIGVSGYVYIILTVAILYKILGREG